jgi:hypothetical protein
MITASGRRVDHPEKDGGTRVSVFEADAIETILDHEAPDLTDHHTASILLRMASEVVQPERMVDTEEWNVTYVSGRWVLHDEAMLIAEGDLGTVAARALLAAWGEP